MKFLISFSAFASMLFAMDTFAASCANVGGTYISNEGLHVKYEQSSCLTLTRFIATRAPDGSVDYVAEHTFPLDGTPVCNRYDSCESVRASQDYVEFTLNFNGGVHTDSHGWCNHRGYKLAKDAQGNLTATFTVFGCSDRFKGIYVEIFQKN